MRAFPTRVQFHAGKEWDYVFDVDVGRRAPGG